MIARVPIMAILWLMLVGPSFAQRQSTSVTQRRILEMSRFVPESAGLFVTIRQPIKLNKALARIRAGRLLPAMTGQVAGLDTTVDLRESLKQYVSVNPAIDVDELMRADVALIAPSWREIGQAHFLVRLRDLSVLDRWFPKKKRRRNSKLGEATFISLNDGLFVCVRGRYMVLARRSASRSLLRETQRLMVSAKRRNAVDIKAFLNVLDDLEGQPLATIFVSSDMSQSSDPAKPPTMWSGAGYAMASLYEGDNQLDVVLRTTSKDKVVSPPLTVPALLTFRRLPYSTLFAAAGTIDCGALYDSLLARKGNQWGQRYLSLLSGVAGRETPNRSLIGHLGPEVIVVWGQTLTAEGTLPQVALMIRTNNQQEARSEVTRVFVNILKLATLLDPVDQRRSPSFEMKTYLGSHIIHVPLSDYASQSRFSFLSLLRNADPAWAIYEDWLILAMTSSHIESILDAQHGLVPRLTSISGVAQALAVKPGQRVLAVSQLELVSHELDSWLMALDAGAPSLLSPSWWNISVARQGWPNVLGIDVDVRDDDGAVWVSGVRPGSAAAKVVMKGDRILSVDDEVLDLEQPYLDFQDRLSQVGVIEPFTFRILRGSAIVEVKVEANRAADRTDSRSFLPADTVRALAGFGRALYTATLSTQKTVNARQVTRVSLHFIPPSVQE